MGQSVNIHLATASSNTTSIMYFRFKFGKGFRISGNSFNSGLVICLIGLFNFLTLNSDTNCLFSLICAVILLLMTTYRATYDLSTKVGTEPTFDSNCDQTLVFEQGAHLP
mmetsp:Transcript_9830/g.18498  ORF Transcript_9830/g.18498 Transcript_9830/m.18498 type:complete len:110 (-) Transcript_9830:1219-1548(-)